MADSERVQKNNRIFLSILTGFIALLLVIRGAVALATGYYETTVRWSGRYELYGASAHLAGVTHIALGLGVLCITLMVLKPENKHWKQLMAGFFGLSVLCIGAQFAI
jgi:hypothetical protein